MKYYSIKYHLLMDAYVLPNKWQDIDTSMLHSDIKLDGIFNITNDNGWSVNFKYAKPYDLIDGTNKWSNFLINGVRQDEVVIWSEKDGHLDIVAHTDNKSLLIPDDAARTILGLQKEIHVNAVAEGWWDEDRSDAECIALMHSELSEALEALRAGNPPDEHIHNLPSLDVELADCIIRILDYAEARGIDMTTAIQAKNAVNRTRPHKHGGKKF